MLPASRSRHLLVTTDPVIYGRHFDDAISPAAAAEKLLKRNLSDIAAMGGRPRSAVVSLALPRRVSIVWIRAFYRALARCAQGLDRHVGERLEQSVCNPLFSAFQSFSMWARVRTLRRGQATIHQRLGD